MDDNTEVLLQEIDLCTIKIMGTPTYECLVGLKQTKDTHMMNTNSYYITTLAWEFKGIKAMVGV